MSSGEPAGRKARFGARAGTGLGIGAFLLVLALLFLGRGRPGAQTLLKPPGSAQTSFTVATWNLRDCAARDPVTKAEILFHDDIARFLAKSEVDIAVFEEVQADKAKGGDITLLSSALARAGRPMPFTAVADLKGEDDIAIFSRYEILFQETILAPAKGDPWPRAGLHAVVSVEGKSLHVFGFHFKAMGDLESENARIAQAKSLAYFLASRYSEELKSGFLLLAGDFNTVNVSDLGKTGSTLSYLSMKEDKSPENDLIPSNYLYMQNQSTFNDSRYSSLLDHILLSQRLGIGLSEGKVHVLRPEKRQDGIPVSDHSLVAVELPFPLR
jgi:endonuclease/exonuclease/phosphatase family metal-dependent hydrolase